MKNPIDSVRKARPLKAVRKSKAAKAIRKSKAAKAIRRSKSGKAVKRGVKRASREASKAKRRLFRALDAGSGGPLGKRTRKQLYDRARELGIKGRSKMKKSQLIAAIRKAI